MGLQAVLEVTFVILFMQLGWKVSFNLFIIIFLGVEMPREVFLKYRNENMRKNFLDEITEKDP